MSNRLFVFGDSFAESYPKGWTTLLSDRLQLTPMVYGAAGSSIEYSYLQLIKALEKNLIATGDVVIFVATESERLDLEYNLLVDPISCIFNKVADMIRTRVHRSHDWAVENQSYLEWYVTNRSKKLLDTKFLLHVGFIRALSDTYPGTKFLVIPAFETSFDISNSTFIRIAENTDNFLVITRPCLFDISHGEWCAASSRKKRDKRWQRFQQYFKIEPRMNHFSNPTISILVDLLYQVIVTWDDSKFKLHKFPAGILDPVDVSTIEDIRKKFIDTNILDKDLAEKCMN